MTPEELRADIPAVSEEGTAYFNTGASGPSPRRVVDALAEKQAHHSYKTPCEEGMYPGAYEVFDETRESVSRLLGADPAEIALTQSTTDGINVVADSIRWDEDDVVVRTDVEHPAGILPWDRLADLRGIEVRTIENDEGYFDLDDFKTAVEDATLVCVSSLAWNYGTRLPVQEITEIAHDAGAMVLCDGVQSPGQMPVDVNEWGVDFYAGAGHKWLLGPWGAGFLYIDEDILPEIQPKRIGSSSVVDYSADEYEFKDGASKMEVSTKSVASYGGLQEAIDMMLDIGLDTVESRIEELTDHLKAEVGEERLNSPIEYHSGLVSFDVHNPDEFVEELKVDDIVMRTIPYPKCVRASVHAFNTTEDIDALVAHLD
ncbi:MAG: aminotransferase class V-fold PLP-dependent enzyme [Halobacteriales archaeon]